jgi:hypothetical protein
LDLTLTAALPNETIGTQEYSCPPQSEIAAHSGFSMDTSGKSKEDLILQDDLVSLMPHVNEANAMSEELNKKAYFEIILVSAAARGLKSGLTEVKVSGR